MPLTRLRNPTEQRSETNRYTPTVSKAILPQQQQPEYNEDAPVVDQSNLSSRLKAIHTQSDLSLSLQTVMDSQYDDDFPDANESVMSNDATAGLLTGLTNDNFISSAMTTAESYLPAKQWEVKWLNDKGDFDPSITNMSDWLGIDEAGWDSMTPAQRRVLITKTTKDRIAKHFDADTNSATYVAGNIVGMLVDPTTLIPIVGASTKARMAYAAMVGGSDLAVYETAHEGAPTLGGVVLGATLGAGIVGLGVAIGKGITKTSVAKANRSVAGKKLEKFKQAVEANMAKTDDPIKALRQAHKDAGVNFNQVAKLIEESNDGLSSYQASKRARTWFDRTFEPISDHVKAMNPKVWKSWMNMERSIMEDNHKFMALSDSFLSTDRWKSKNKVSLTNLKNGDAAQKAAFKGIKKAMLNNDLDTTKALVRQHMGEKAIDDLELYRSATDEMYDLLKQYRGTEKAPLGKKISGIYMHRKVQDIDALRAGLAKLHGKTNGKEILSRIDSIIAKKQATKATPLSKGELENIYNKYFAGYFDKASTRITPSGIQSRKLAIIPDELVDSFYDPAEAMHSYFKENVIDYHRKAFFGKDIVKANGDDVGASIGDLVVSELKAGRLAESNREPLHKLLELRWTTGTQSPNAAIQWFKDVGYSSLLGNPISAITQLGDVALASAKYGLRDTMAGTVDTILGRGLSPKEYGLLDTLLEEMATKGQGLIPGVKAGWNPSTKKVLRNALTYGGFKSVDQFGKAVHLTSSWRSLQRAIKTPKGMLNLHAKWGEALGNRDFSKAINAIKHGDLSNSNVKTMIFSDLADIQPITLFEMPANYLKHPNGRLLYMLRTFQMKYYNALRKHMYYNLKKGNIKAGLTAGTALFTAFTAGGAGTDMLKNFLMGRDVYPKDIVLDVAFRNSGILDRYTLDRVSTDKDPITPIVSNILPPLNILSPVTNTAIRAGMGEVDAINWNNMVKQIPVVGKVAENFLMDGRHDYNQKRWNE